MPTLWVLVKDPIRSQPIQIGVTIREEQMGQHHLSLSTHPSLGAPPQASPPVTSPAISSPLRSGTPSLAPRSPAALTWRTGQCHVPEGCGSPLASSAGSALTLGAPCSLPGESQDAVMGPSRRVHAVNAHAAPSPRRRGGAPLQAQCLSRAGPSNGVFAGPAQRMCRASLAAGASGDPAWAAAPAPRSSQRTAL